MSILQTLKPPCVNENMSSNMTMNTLDNSFSVLAQAISCPYHKLKELSNVQCLKNNYTGKVYTFGDIYAACKQINDNTDLTCEEWDGFIEDLLNNIKNFDSKSSLESIISDLINYSAEDIENELADCVESHEDFNEEVYSNLFIRRQVVDDMLEQLKYNPFARLPLELVEIAREHNILG